MKIKILILSLIAFAVSLILLVRFYLHFEDNSYQEKITKTKSLISSGKKTIALYDSAYTELKRLNGTVLSKRINFFYVVDGKKYTKDKEIRENPASPVFTITYLPNNPDVYSENPEEDLKNLTNTGAPSSSTYWFLFLGSIAGFYWVRRQSLKEQKQATELAELLSQ
jgi:hypothetical protein